MLSPQEREILFTQMLEFYQIQLFRYRNEHTMFMSGIGRTYSFEASPQGIYYDRFRGEVYVCKPPNTDEPLSEAQMSAVCEIAGALVMPMLYRGEFVRELCRRIGCEFSPTRQYINLVTESGFVAAAQELDLRLDTPFPDPGPKSREEMRERFIHETVTENEHHIKSIDRRYPKKGEGK